MHKTTRIPFSPATVCHVISSIVCKSPAQTKNEKISSLTLNLFFSYAPDWSHQTADVWRRPRWLHQCGTLQHQNRTVNKHITMFLLKRSHLFTYRPAPSVEHTFISRFQVVNYSTDFLLALRRRMHPLDFHSDKDARAVA